jgi:dihydrofolate synthase / folylpolyglutamate synthase
MTKATPPRRGTPVKAAPAADISTFPNAVRYLLERVDYERMRVIRYDQATFKLDRMRRLLDLLGNPQEQVKMVHVAGTVGKGSTVAMIANMLQGCGYAVGQYTSPHVTDIRERIAINGQWIGRTEFTDLSKQVATVVEKLDFEPTFFELITAMAFKHFAEQAVDIAVVEVGLGGRLDSTNVITPLASVITQIDYDHTHLLGRTLDKIAKEKAGIFKPGVPAFTIEQPREAEMALKQAAEEVGAPLKVINKDIEFSYRFGASDDLGPHTRVCLITQSSQFMHLPVPLPGEHQAFNCALALAAIDAVKAAGFNIPEAQLHEGLAKTALPGRMELIWDQPRILVDGAHNAASLSALMRCVGAHVPYDSMVCIFGCCEDKDIPAMLEKVALGGDKVIFTRAKGNPRAMDPDELQREFIERSGKMSQVARTIGEALDLASRAVGRDDLICVTGSFYLVGDTKKYLTELDKKHMQTHADRAEKPQAAKSR